MKKVPIKKILSALFLLFTMAGCEEIIEEPEIEEEKSVQELVDQYFTQEQQDMANTAKEVSYLTDDERDVIFFCNLARLDGKAFCDALLDIRDSDNSYEKSLVETLDTTKDVPMLYPNEQLCKASAAHAEDIGPKGLVQHASSDGTKTFDRVRQYYNSGTMAENIAAGNGKALAIVRQLLVDQGVESLGHRKNILSAKYNRIGVAIRPHSTYKYCCVQDFSDDTGE
jgi:hypothetical protein